MTLDKKPETIQTMFNLISNQYDFINNIISFGTHKLIKSNCIKYLGIKPHDKILDLCTGTGDIAEIIRNQQPNAIITGIDFSEKMLKIAKDKIKGIDFIQGDASNLPFSDNSYDFVTICFGLRNIQNAEKTVEEAYRILKPGGKFLHLDFGEKNFANKLFDKLIPNLIKIFSKNTYAYSYLIKSKQAFLTPNELIKDFESKGFKFIKRIDYLFSVISCQIMEKP